MATTKKRRKYMGPVPKEQRIVLDHPALKADEPIPYSYIESINRPKVETVQPKRRGRKPGSKNQPKVASGNNPT